MPALGHDTAVSPQPQCQASQPGAHLAWVQEPREAATMRKVLSYYQRTQPVWIGLRLGYQGEGWRWVNGTEYSGASGIPRRSAGSGACAALPNVGGFTHWISTDCSQQHFFLCKVVPEL
ncbi:PREDICTED: regenerating islet-derived protein 4 [Tinamus guttatus]|uniref:regenerating islet-derived protein 4 n=1 Tax=Tinamus guttatus TaxID=94827 RepID=UPI00052E843F|nr:PREDICTED: regenerating islet-derived protein 4 [Tinamus guttatus]